LLFNELSCLLVEVADGFEGEPAGDVVGVVVWRGLQVGGPAFGSVEELGKGLADVVVAGAVVVEVVIELVGDGGELFEEVVSVLFAAGFAGVSVEILYLLVARVEELDEDEKAVVGEVGSFAELLDFAFGECAVGALRIERQSKSKCQECEQEPTGHWFLVFEDLSE
jgi:hypothetical protein